LKFIQYALYFLALWLLYIYKPADGAVVNMQRL